MRRGTRHTQRPVHRRHSLAEQDYLGTADCRRDVGRPRVHRQQCGRLRTQRHNPRHRHVRGDIVQPRDAGELYELRIQAGFRRRTDQHDRVVRMAFAEVAQDRSPAFGWPVFVIHGEPPQTAPHGALVAHLHEDERHSRESAGRQQCRHVGPLRIADGERTAGMRRGLAGPGDSLPRGWPQLRQAMPVLRDVLARQQRVIMDVDDALRRDAGARQQVQARIATITEPRRHAALQAQPAHQLPLIGRQQVGRLAAADGVDHANPRLAAQQRHAPGAGSHDINRTAPHCMQLADQCRQQDHVAERTKAHDQRPAWQLMVAVRTGVQTPSSGFPASAGARATPIRSRCHAPKRK